MATASGTRRSRFVLAREGEELTPLRRRRRLWFAGGAAGTALLLLAAWLAPALVAHTPLRNRVLASLAGDIDGELRAGGASFGWFSSPILRDVELRDRSGQTLFAGETLTGDKTLAGLLLDSGQAGRFRLEGVELTLVLDEKGSNVQDVFAPWLTGESSLECPAVSLEVSEATVTIQDKVSKKSWKFQHVSTTLDLAKDWSEPLRLKAAGDLAHGKPSQGNPALGKSPLGGRTAHVAADATLTRKAASDGPPETKGHVHLTAKALPLALLDGVFRRAKSDVRAAGRLTSDLVCDVAVGGTSPPHVTVEGKSTIDDLALSGPWRQQERLELARLDVPCRVTCNGQRLRIERLAAQCDLGAVSLQGAFEIDLGQPVQSALWSALLRQNYALRGEVDVAALAQALPDTLRIRDGLQFTEGDLQFDLARQVKAPRGAGRAAESDASATWNGHLNLDRLAAMHHGRRLSWDKPVQVTFAARDGSTGPIVDNLLCESSFLKFEAAGTLSDLSLSAEYDLNRLSAELGRFVDLGQLTLAGDGWANLHAKQGKRGLLEADGEVQVRNLRIAVPDGGEWSEENLVLVLTAKGHAAAGRLTALETGSLEMTSGDDTASVVLTQPVEKLGAAAWPLRLTASGSLATWGQRTAPLVPALRNWQLAGGFEFNSLLRLSPQEARFERTRLALEQLEAVGPGLWVQEPSAELNVSGRWERRENRLDVPKLDLASTALNVEARQIVCTGLGSDDVRLTGTANYSGDLGRLFACTIDPSLPAAWSLAGNLTGRTNIVQTGRSITFDSNVSLNNVAAAYQGEVLRREKRIDVRGKGDLQWGDDQLRIQRLDVDSELLHANARGELSELSTRRVLSLQGKLDYDAQQLLVLMRPYVGEGLTVEAGRDAHNFTLSAPLAALNQPALEQVAENDNQAPAHSPIEEITAETGFGWTGANVYGFQVGQAEVLGKLQNGRLDISPLDLAVSEGRLTTEPVVTLWPQPAELALPPGPLLEKVRISPEMCERGLKYIAPVLAGVAEAEGRFSVELDQCRLPLAEPAAGELAGRMTVHDVQVGPGALVRELAVLLSRPAAAKLSKESVVTFQMADGRIYHRDLELVFPDVTIRTHGSVGLDQTLSILAEMPVPPKWIGKNPLGAALKGQTIRLPIAGTLSRPKIDERALAKLSGQFLRDNAQGVLMEGLKGGFDKLFGPPPAEPKK